MSAIHGPAQVDHFRLPFATGVMKRTAMVARLQPWPRRLVFAGAVWLAVACPGPLEAQQPQPAPDGRPGITSSPLPQGHPAISPSPMGQHPVTMPYPAASAPTSPSTDGRDVLAGEAQAVQSGPVAADAPAATGSAERLPPSGVAAGLPHDLSPWGMFMQADVVVKAVMIGLAFASLATWTVWLAKSIELAAAKRRVRRSLRGLVEARSLDEAEGHLKLAQLEKDVVAALVQAARQEEDVSADLPADGIKERASAALSRIEARAGRLMTRGTGLLATIGATAPFVGLFGTVWGIMNSFVGIARSNTTNLAVVAPGIAEALLATAIGLVAAIPAVIIYNVFARSITGYRALLADAGTEVMRHLSRDLDRRAAAPHRRKPGLFAAAE